MQNVSDHLDWQRAKLPHRKTLQGRFVRLEKLNCVLHADDLWNACHGPDSDPHLWDFFFAGPFTAWTEFFAWLALRDSDPDRWTYVVIDQNTGEAEGFLALRFAVPVHGRIEIGSVTFGAGMQRTPKSTEALYLLAKEAFALGYRRLEWSSSQANARSHRSAQRFGFRLEGVLRQHVVFKGQNSDNAWYSIIHEEWPVVERACQVWLAPENFDEQGGQKNTLENIRASLKAIDAAKDKTLQTDKESA
ncbi:hypothetical protein BV898_11984 [Hypsibius exemplaris]|uniref:N-acetyltransferase domain-containing protein n=1 Tax=Hypsibius exemplaris TaxID=2072580 RepID=A0A1W0WEY3_HYPEX|nr:hypothetical protein BV898_11984 [Hypsibius exemplaris]